MGREEKWWRKNEHAAGSDAGGLNSSPSDDELLRIWDELEPQTPSQAFTERVEQLIDNLRKEEKTQRVPDDEFDSRLQDLLSATNTDFGATLTVLRERCQLSRVFLHHRLHVDTSVLTDLESNAVYPETLPATFWIGYAAAVQCRTELIAGLIASYDRGRIAVSGAPAARSGPDMAPERRAFFLSEPEPAVTRQLDRRREQLVDALRQSR